MPAPSLHAAPAARHVAELPLSRDPLEVAADLARASRGRPHVVLEESGRFSCALGAWAEVVVDRTVVRLAVEGQADVVVPWSERPLTIVAELLAGLGPGRGRAYGIVGFELARTHAGLSVGAGTGDLLRVVIPRTEVILEVGRATVRSRDAVELDEVVRLLRAPAERSADTPESPTSPLGIDDPTDGRDRYRAAVAAGVAAIAAGEVQKVVVSRTVPVSGEVDLPDTYVRGRLANTPARSYLLHLGDLEAVGFSPEIVVAVDARRTVRTQPLAGTRALLPDRVESRRLRDELLLDGKEIHEHAISVKLAVEEMRPLCAPGTVRVEEFMMVEERGTVQHLASRVAGELADGVSSWDALAALFPAVTASGIPKREAFDLIRRLEGRDRGLYGGAVMTLDEDGVLDAALVLRTLFRQGGDTWLQAGAGVVIASSPERELEETREKLASIANHVVRVGDPAATTAVVPAAGPSV